MSLSNAFEVTADDVYTVLIDKGISLSDKRIDEIYAEHIAPAADSIAIAALDGGDDLEKQTDAAYTKLAEILDQAGLLVEPETKPEPEATASPAP